MLFIFIFFKKSRMDQKKSKVQVPDKSHKVAVKVPHRKITKPYYLVLRVVFNTKYFVFH